ncbi:chorismate mutase [Thraustotheca clavata]|uniref:chorismate mutase n=1 Tax=Thraustotheca clavata TaxID=74557 RepID=A0A1W0A0H3_9STRA|nr:chorismate mutase [Thraustotheca clavata]
MTRVLLDDYRNDLIRQEETIIFALIERAQFARNAAIYRKRSETTPSLREFKGKYSSFQGSFLDFLLSGTEKLHALNRRYTAPDENAFFPHLLPEPILQPVNYPTVLIPNSININEQIMNVYLQKILPHVTVDVDDSTTYGSAANADVAVLQALSKRIHFGKFIAEAKFQAETEKYTQLIRNNDAAGIMATLTNMVVEEKVAKRVCLKASTYGQDIDTQASGNPHWKVDPQLISDLYLNYVMPLTKEVQVAYLLQRLHHPSVSFVGPVGSLSYSAAINHFGDFAKRNFEAVASTADLFTNVGSNKTAYGVVAFEDALTGIVKDTQLRLLQSHLKIIAETVVVKPFIIARKESSKEVSSIYLPASAEASFGNVIDRLWSTAKVIVVGSVDEASRRALEEENAIAITTDDAATAFELKHIVETPSWTKPPPTTSVRFIIVGKACSSPTGKDKTCLSMSVKHEVGSLLSALQVFKDNGVNMTRLESIPRQGNPWDYDFFVELDGHHDDDKIKKALDQLKSHTTNVQDFGSFPAVEHEQETN